MDTSRAALAITMILSAAGCSGIDTAPPTVGDVGDTSASELTFACGVGREELLNGAQGGRRTAMERGFGWLDAGVTYDQGGSYEGYRTDCSGFVSMCWELGSSYTTANFINDTGEWTSLGSFDDLQPADAMVYRSGDSGHIVMFLGWNDTAKSAACVLEQASKASDMQFRARTIDSLQASGYHAIRATKFGGASSGGADDPGADPGSGSGTGGGSGAQCYCDASCTDYGDCCSNCSGSGSGSGGSSSGGSGSGTGGGSGAQCYCDASCADYGDCCADCGGTGTGGSGSGTGGGSGAQCYCDASCAQYGDCCADCSGSGSGGSSGGSYCGDGYCDTNEDTYSCSYDCW